MTKSTALFSRDAQGQPVDAWIWDELLQGDPPPSPDDPYFHALGGPGSGDFGHSGRPGEVGGSGPGFGSAPLTKAGAAAWRRKNQERYEMDKDFRGAVDAATLLTQGSTDLIRAASVAADGKGEGLRPYYLRHFDEPLSTAANPISSYKNYFKGQDVEKADYMTLREAGVALNKAIDTSPQLSVPIYRGMPVSPTVALTPGQRLDPVSGHVVITNEKVYERYRQQVTRDYTKSAKPVANPYLTELGNLKAGDTMHIAGVTSFTSDKYTAQEFSRGESRGQGGRRGESSGQRYTPAVTLEVHGARGLPVAALSPWNQREVLTRGDFEVVSNTKTAYSNGLHDYHIVLKAKK